MARHRVAICTLIGGLLLGGVASGQTPPPLALTIQGAVALALRGSLDVLEARAAMAGAAGALERDRAALLPRTTASSIVDWETRNLAILGLSVPGIPNVVGPFGWADFRISADQAVIDRPAYHVWKAGQKQSQASQLSYQSVRDAVAEEAGARYLNGETAAAQVQTAAARVATSEALEQLARDQRTQGLATGVDLLRAQVQLTRDRQTLLVAQDAYQTALLVLARFLGLRPGVPIVLGEQLAYQAAPLPDADAAIRSALQARTDYQALVAQRDALREQHRASEDRALPRLDVSGDYGFGGRSPTVLPATGQIEAVVSISLFDRDRRGQMQELASQVDRLDADIADLQRGIEQEVRKAIIDLRSASDEVTVADSGVALAARELDMARDRFANGVTDNIEVITAQASLAQAQDDRTAARATYASARLAYARAIGSIDTGTP